MNITVDSLDQNLPVVVAGIIVLFTVLSLIYFKVLKKDKHALHPDEWKEFKLVNIEQLSHDVKKFRFALPSNDHVLGLPIGQHISLKYVDTDGNEVQRSYTPISSNDDKGHVEFVIKVYFKDVHPRFPLGGKMSQHLNSMAVGDTLHMKGPRGHLDYRGHGLFKFNKRHHSHQRHVKMLGMVAGGTGITPMYQIIKAIMKDPNDKTQVWLIYANQREEDILLRQELESFPKDRFHLWYTLDHAPEGWKYSNGFVDKEMCRYHLPPPSSHSFLLVCGPPPMIKYACEPAFKDIGYEESQWHAF